MTSKLFLDQEVIKLFDRKIIHITEDFKIIKDNEEEEDDYIIFETSTGKTRSIHRNRLIYLYFKDPINREDVDVYDITGENKLSDINNLRVFTEFQHLKNCLVKLPNYSLQNEVILFYKEHGKLKYLEDKLFAYNNHDYKIFSQNGKTLTIYVPNEYKATMNFNINSERLLWIMAFGPISENYYVFRYDTSVSGNIKNLYIKPMQLKKYNLYSEKINNIKISEPNVFDCRYLFKEGKNILKLEAIKILNNLGFEYFSDIKKILTNKSFPFVPYHVSELEFDEIYFDNLAHSTISEAIEIEGITPNTLVATEIKKEPSETIKTPETEIEEVVPETEIEEVVPETEIEEEKETPITKPEKSPIKKYIRKTDVKYFRDFTIEEANNIRNKFTDLVYNCNELSNIYNASFIVIKKVLTQPLNSTDFDFISIEELIEIENFHKELKLENMKLELKKIREEQFKEKRKLREKQRKENQERENKQRLEDLLLEEQKLKEKEQLEKSQQLKKEERELKKEERELKKVEQELKMSWIDDILQQTLSKQHIANIIAERIKIIIHEILNEAITYSVDNFRNDFKTAITEFLNNSITTNDIINAVTKKETNS
jgi:hypothetical protein